MHYIQDYILLYIKTVLNNIASVYFIILQLYTLLYYKAKFYYITRLFMSIFYDKTI